METIKAKRLLQISYWVGATIDALMIIPMLFPTVGAQLFGITDFHPDADYRYAMAIGASLMLGWTVLLIWAAKKPFERKGILLITVIPVMLGLIASGIFAVFSNLISVEKMIPTWVLQTVLVALYSYSYFVASNTEQ